MFHGSTGTGFAMFTDSIEIWFVSIFALFEVILGAFKIEKDVSLLLVRGNVYGHHVTLVAWFAVFFTGRAVHFATFVLCFSYHRVDCLATFFTLVIRVTRRVSMFGLF